MKKYLLVFCTAILTSIISATASATVIKKEVGYHTAEDDCPQANNPQYVSDWKEAITFFYTKVDSYTICGFNRSWQQKYYNTDGTPKYSNLNYPTGVPYNLADTGSQTVHFYSDASNLDITGDGLAHQAIINLSDNSLGLPTIKLAANSGELEYNFSAAHATSEYIWLGEDSTLNFRLNYDFFSSGKPVWETKDLEGNVYTRASKFSIFASAYKYLDLSPEKYVSYDQNDLLSSDTHIIELDKNYSEEQPYTGSISVSFDVKQNDTFYLLAEAGLSVMNGSLINAMNTITSEVSINGLPVEESQKLVSLYLQQTDSIEVSAPHPILIFSAFLLLLLKQRKKTL